ELSPETQAFVAAEVAKLETKISAASAAEDDLGFACYGAGPCAEGDPGNNKAIALSAADVAKVESIVEDFVLGRFAERCGADCAKTWNDTVGAALGVKAGD
ncbi:MAG: C4-dicarboxylate ABC transporter substrate-binding protein, partial [Kiloniellales bacterium]|nr:C4-dicarboxylate ABC transporter substrate-binding protein [Kiloniellales bacterium]